MLSFQNKIIYSIILFAVIMIYGCSSTAKLESTYTNNDIKIDGVQTDWKDNLKSVKDQNVAVGFRNDNNNLYVCLVTSDRADMMKILAMGLTVWLTPDNNNDMIGIRYPLKRQPGEFRQFRNEGGQDQENPEERVKRMMSEQNDLEVVDKDNNVISSIPLKGQSGFEAKVGYSNEQLVYELKVPLQNSGSQLAFNPGSKDEVNVKFETGQFDIDQFRNNEGMRENPEGGEGGGERPTGMGGFGRRGGRMGRGGGGNGGNRASFLQQLKFDVDLKLANKS